jgi:GNAT superfamily N-acetyltransferase
MEPREHPSRSYRLQQLSAQTPESTLAEAREILLEYGRFVVAQPGAARFCFGTLEAEAARLPFSYIEQGGGCILAHARGLPAGFIAWRELPASVAPNAWELKRLYVRPISRGLSLGQTLTHAVLERALAAGRRSVYLDTAPAAMAPAVRIYQAMGFEPCPPFNDNPVEGLAWFVKNL